jgi:uncharacterized lipoprotein
MREVPMRLAVAMFTIAVLGLALAGAVPAQDETTQVFNAPVDRVWSVTTSVLNSLGWKVDKEDRGVGWLVTKSRGLDHDDWGVYAKGTRHRLRVVIKEQGQNRTAVTVERRVWKEERILWVDKEEVLPVTDRTVEQRILSEIARSL